MREMLNYYILSKPEQYESVMKMLYDNEIFPLEEDPVDLKDYIDNFNFYEQADGFLKFYLWCNKESDMQPFKETLQHLPNYDGMADLPRLELESDTDET